MTPTVSSIAFVFGASLFGWLLPEFIFILATRGREINIGINILSTLAAACVALRFA